MNLQEVYGVIILIIIFLFICMYVIHKVKTFIRNRKIDKFLNTYAELSQLEKDIYNAIRTVNK